MWQNKDQVSFASNVCNVNLCKFLCLCWLICKYLFYSEAWVCEWLLQLVSFITKLHQMQPNTFSYPTRLQLLYFRIIIAFVVFEEPRVMVVMLTIKWTKTWKLYIVFYSFCIFNVSFGCFLGKEMSHWTCLSINRC